MIRFLRLALAGLALLALTACGGGMFSGSYLGPEVTGIVVHKAERKMYILHGNQPLKIYDIQLGGNPVGPKQFEGDLKTPEGEYWITQHNPKSQFHLSLRISYPNPQDVAYAKSQGKDPGGDIFIHGEYPYGGKTGDWTIGCIAVTNEQMDVIYAMVKNGTPIWILP
jgi:murein L,D-transpeptidase YafK